MFLVMSVCLCVCVSVQAVTFEPLDIETSFLVCKYILTISRSSLVSRSMGQGQGHMRKNDSFTYFNFLILYMWLQVINEVKVTHQGEGHIKIKVKYLHSFKFYVAHTFCKRVVCIQLKCYLFSLWMRRKWCWAILRELGVSDVGRYWMCKLGVSDVGWYCVNWA